MNITNLPSLSLSDPAVRNHHAPISTPPPAQDHLDDLADGFVDTNLSDEASIEDQDEAQAALQPAISAAASHLTSAQTPAAEKAAALERVPSGGGGGGGSGGSGGSYFANIIPEGDEEGDGDEDESDLRRDALLASLEEIPLQSPRRDGTAEPTFPKGSQAQVQDQLPLPSPWTTGPKSFVVSKDSPHSRQTKGLLGSAFDPTRRRSRSAGQEALRKLQKAFPSLAGHTSLLPSLPTSFLSSLTGDHRNNSNAT
ncbi:hypothetical protein QQS21_006710, partial [Conoideocrella luteorostrata]